VSLQDSLTVMTSYTATLQETLRAIRDGLPPDKPVVDVQKVLSTQEYWSAEMAGQLEGLAEHFEKMEVALRESEAGEEFDESDIQGMWSRAPYLRFRGNSGTFQEMMRDAEELPVILCEVEDAGKAMERSLYVIAYSPMALNELDLVLSEELLSAKQTSQQYLQKHRSTLEDLEELGDIMEDMLRRQDEIEVCRCD
jgi:autophagy-related protein 17